MKKVVILSGMLSSYLYGSDNPAYQELVEKYKQCLSGASTFVEEMECTEKYLIWGFEGCQKTASEKQEREVKECSERSDKCIAESKERTCTTEKCRSEVRAEVKECRVREEKCQERAKDTFEKSEKHCREVSERDQKSIDNAVKELGKTAREPLGLGFFKKK